MRVCFFDKILYNKLVNHRNRTVGLGREKNCMYDIAICDDNAADREWLRELLLDNEKCPEEINIHEFGSGEEMLDCMADQRFTLIFLDIQMDGMDGNDTAKEIRKQDNKLLLVFITGFVEPTTLSFEVQPFRYLMKQMPVAELHKNITAIFEKMILDSELPLLSAKIRGRNVMLSLDDIIYIEKYKRKSRLHLSPWATAYFKVQKHEDVVCDKKLNQIYDQLKCYGFGCPHDSYVINIRYVTEASSKSFRLKGIDNEFSITRTKAHQFSSQKNIHFVSKYIRGKKYGV